MRIELATKGLFTSLAENRIPPGRAFSGQNFTVDDGTVKARPGYALTGRRSGYSANDVCWGVGYGKFTNNAVHKLQITGSPTSGTVILRSPIQGATNSSDIPWDAYPSDMIIGVQPWTNFDDGEINFSGGPWPNEPIFVSYGGRYAGQAESLITLQTNNLSGGSVPTLSITSYVTGGEHEVYLAVIQPNGSGTSTLYAITSTDGFVTATWTSIATGLTSSDWFFEQIEDKIYACNGTDGIAWYQLGGSWSGTAGISGVQNPNRTIVSLSPYSDQSASSAPLSPFLWNAGGADATFAYTGFGSNPTAAIASSKQYVDFKLNAALASDTVSITATLNAAQDYSHQDLWRVIFISKPSEIAIDPSTILFELTNNDGSPVNIDPPFLDSGISNLGNTSGSTIVVQRQFHFGSFQRNYRDNTIKIKLTFTVPLGTLNTHFQLYLYPLDTWMNDTMDGLNMSQGATIGAIPYAYAYQRASDGALSKLSPITRFQFPGFTGLGSHVQLVIQGSGQLTTSDYINVYRLNRLGLWAFIGQTANVTGLTTATFIDRNMLDELDGYPVFGTVQLPGGFLPTKLGLWKGSLVAAADRKIFISKTGFPLVFAPDPQNLSLARDFASLFSLDATAPRTAYMASNRSEQVYAIVGQDSLYIAGPITSYAMTDNDGTPNGLSPARAMPGARGCLGTRASAAKSGGAMIASLSGLWYYSVSIGFTGTIGAGTIVEEELSKEVRGTWDTAFGPASSGAVVFEFNEETYAVNGNKAIKWTRNHEIEYHVYADSFKDFIPTQQNGLIGFSASGQMFRFGDNYTTDAGTAIAWSWVSGKLEGARSRLLRIETQYQGSPQIRIDAWDGDAGTEYQVWDTLEAAPDGAVNYYPSEILIQGWRYRVTLSGGSDDVLESLALEFEGASGGRGN